MNRSLPPSVTDYVGKISIPACDLSAIQTRRTVQRRSSLWNPWMSAVVATGILVAILANVPAVVAQVERVFRAFTIIDGHTVPLAVQTVSLEQARSHVPFTVIAPAGVPGGLRPTIRAFSSESSPNQARLMFEYRKSAADAPPALTIMETTDNGRPDRNVLFMTKSSDTVSVPSLPPVPTQAGDRQTVAVQDYKLVRDGKEKHWRVKLTPVTWAQHGTRVMLMSSPDGLSDQQLNGIRTAMQAQ